MLEDPESYEYAAQVDAKIAEIEKRRAAGEQVPSLEYANQIMAELQPA